MPYTLVGVLRIRANDGTVRVLHEKRMKIPADSGRVILSKIPTFFDEDGKVVHRNENGVYDIADKTYHEI